MMTDNRNLIGEIRKGLLGWYNIPEDASVLYIGGADEPIAELLNERIKKIFVIDVYEFIDLLKNEKEKSIYDYIISVAAPERVLQPECLFSCIKKALKADGHLILGMNNRMGIRYFCGDHDPYTGHVFDGIDNYSKREGCDKKGFSGRCYDEAEIYDFLIEAGWSKDEIQIWGVFPGLEYPTMLFSEDYSPNEDLANRLFPEYFCSKSIFLEEEYLYSSLIHNGLFHKMANAYLIECAPKTALSDLMNVTSSVERGGENALYTIVHRGIGGRAETVEKCAVYPEGKKRLRSLFDNMEHLRETGVPVVDGRITDGCYLMPFEHFPVGQQYMKDLLENGNVDGLFKVMDKFRDEVMISSQLVDLDSSYTDIVLSQWKTWFISNGHKEAEWPEFKQCFYDGKILRTGFFDMAPLNSFYDDQFIFFDQEFIVPYLPVKELLWRMIATFYSGNPHFEKILPRDKALERYGLLDNKKWWEVIELDYLKSLRSEDELKEYHKLHRRDFDKTEKTRLKIDFGVNDYDRVFDHIFDGCSDKPMILFGSGRYAERFMQKYRSVYEIKGIFDNNPTKWGEVFENVKISEPSIEMAKDCKVMICIRDYQTILEQLDKLGIKDISVFDPNRKYEG